MKSDLRESRKLLVVLPISILAIFALSVFPSVHAYGKTDNWQMGFAGTFILPGVGNDGFWGWCGLAGISSGTDADCQVSQYFHPAGGGGLTCETNIQVTSWDIEPSTVGPGFDFFFLSGHVTVNPASATFPCLASFGGIIDPTTGNFVAPFDTGFPAAPGHYNLNSFVGHPGELQIQVTFTHS